MCLECTLEIQGRENLIIMGEETPAWREMMDDDFQEEEELWWAIAYLLWVFAEKIYGKGERQKPRKAWKRGMARSFAKRTFEYKCVMFNNNNFISTDILKP